MSIDLFSMVENQTDNNKEPNSKRTSQQEEVEPSSVIKSKNEMSKQNNKTGKEMAIKAYTREEILKSSTEYFAGDSLAADVWMNKYALRDGDQIYELNPDDMHNRLASEFARIEEKYPNPMKKEEIFGLMKDFKYIVPQGSPMSGIGNDFQIVSLSNCFVIGNSGDSDSYGGILKIEGRNNLDKNYNNYEYSPPKNNNYGKDIKRELRKIYNLKPIPSKPPKRLVQLPRINP